MLAVLPGARLPEGITGTSGLPGQKEDASQ
jgi:hypothetical protein